MNKPDPQQPDQYCCPAVTSYRHKRSVSGPWHIEMQPLRLFSGAVVIPALAESGNLAQTLLSLSRNPRELLTRFLILVVVNNRIDATPEEKNDNRQTLAYLPLWKEQFDLEHFHWIDAAEKGKELPLKQGVGLARKIGLDLALPHLDFSSGDPLLICLDSDTLVQPDYLPAICEHFSTSAAGGASIPYRHRPTDTPRGQAAIDRYELFLRSYVLGLELAGSPYAFHTVGSAMACTASAYALSGGMNHRMAGEDFYFLQQVHKTSGVSSLTGTIVHPSPRSSLRVPFGTGRAVGDMLADGDDRLLFYQPELFEMLGKWLGCVSNHGGADGGELLGRAGGISPWLEEFLQLAGFGAAWDNLCRHNPEDKRLLTAFHGWFDAFRTMRLMHHLTDRAYPRIAPEKAVPRLLERAGLVGPETVSELLESFRKLQGV